MIDTRRLGHITFFTPDLAQQVDYYQHVIGLSVVERSATRCVLATKVGHEAVVSKREIKHGRRALPCKWHPARISASSRML